jgi:hypothetical protein
VVVVALLLAAEEVCRTVTVWPLDTVPATAVYAPLLMAYVPPVMLIGAGLFIPATVMAFEVMAVLAATPVWAVKLNAFGVESVDPP